MVKNRNVLVIFFILLALVAGIVLSCVLLRADSFEVQILSEPSFQLTEDCSAATDAYLGKSILFLNVGDVRRDIEEKVPYAKVEKVEKNVSRTVVVKLTERYEYFCIRLKEGDAVGEEYIVTDGELKVLRTGEGEAETFDGVDKLIDVVIPADLVAEATPGTVLQFTRQSCEDFLRAFVSGAARYADNVFTVRQTFDSLEYFKEPTEEDPMLAGCYVRGLYGCTFDMAGASQAPEAFFEEMFRIFYTEFDTADRETEEVVLRYADGGVVRG